MRLVSAFRCASQTPRFPLKYPSHMVQMSLFRCSPPLALSTHNHNLLVISAAKCGLGSHNAASLDELDLFEMCATDDDKFDRRSLWWLRRLLVTLCTPVHTNGPQRHSKEYERVCFASPGQASCGDPPVTRTSPLSIDSFGDSWK